jgi:hypothetical protein
MNNTTLKFYDPNQADVPEGQEPVIVCKIETRELFNAFYRRVSEAQQRLEISMPMGELEREALEDGILHVAQLVMRCASEWRG